MTGGFGGLRRQLRRHVRRDLETPLAGAVHEAVRPAIGSVAHGCHRIFYDVFEDRAVVQRVPWIIFIEQDFGPHMEQK